MREAHDHHRVSPEGRAIGEQQARMADGSIARLVAEGEPDERCKSCAFVRGTVPNGCLQTQMDALKAEKAWDRRVPDGVQTGEPRGPVHSCKNCAHLAKDSCDDPCAGCTVRWRSGVSDRWAPASGVSVARSQPSTPSPTDGSAE